MAAGRGRGVRSLVVASRTTCAGLIVLSALAAGGCWGDGEQGVAQQGPSAPVVIVMWEKAAQPPRVLQAERVEQLRNDQGTATHCYGVYLRFALGDGEMTLRAPHAWIDEDSGEITFTPPIHLAGIIEGAPFQGRAAAGRLETDDMVLEMADVEWLHLGQRVQVATLQVQDQWRDRRAERPRGQPAPLSLTAAQAALPPNLRLPPHRRQGLGKDSDAAE